MRKEVTVLYATRFSYCMEKTPLKSPIVQHAVYFDPSYIVKNQDRVKNHSKESIRGFELLSERRLNLKRLPSSKYVEEAKEQYKIFVKDVLTSHFEEF